jgi:small subunit ribosomal protein S20
VANHKDAVKRAKQNEARRISNRTYRTRMRNTIKLVRDAVAAGDAKGAMEKLREATSVIHRVVTKGVIHRNQAARRISRLNSAVKAAAVAAKPIKPARKGKKATT